MPKNKKYKPIKYRDLTSTVDRIPQPKGKFVNIFKVMRDRQAAVRELELPIPAGKTKPPSNRQADTATHTHTETNPMPKNTKKKLKPIPYRYSGAIETLREPKGEFVDLFKVMQERAATRRAAETARSQQQNQTSE